jgi:hypothetical protein
VGANLLAGSDPAGYDGFVTYTERIIRGRQVSEHLVQFCDSSDSMAAAAGGFLADAHSAGDLLLIVAREANWINIHRILTSRGIDVGTERLQGRLVAKNAVTTLAELSRKGMPHASSFEAAVGDPVRELAAKGRLSIYGEMVDVLAQLEEIDAAIALEELWNRLAERTPFRLMCGYSSAHFVSRRAELRLRDVCRAHTHVRSDESDPLGGWLLKRSQLGSAASPIQPSRS